jgi:hypothetical protein
MTSLGEPHNRMMSLWRVTIFDIYGKQQKLKSKQPSWCYLSIYTALQQCRRNVRKGSQRHLKPGPGLLTKGVTEDQWCSLFSTHQGCQIFLGKNTKMWGKCTKWPQITPMGHKVHILSGSLIDQMPLNYTDIFHCKTLQNLPKLGFWYENIRSGNPGTHPKSIT